MAIHFIGFKEPQRFANATRIWGNPDFIHHHWDVRAMQEIAPDDCAVFAKGDDSIQPKEHSWDDSAVPCSTCNCPAGVCEAQARG